MGRTQLTFERRELKYVLDDEMRRRLERACAAHMVPDEHGDSTVRSVYLDTPSLEIARTCEEHPTYREKLRLRAYGEPQAGEPVFLELKKKLGSVVYKRRVQTSQQVALELVGGARPPANQIEREIAAAARRHEGIGPIAYLAYDRCAFYEQGNRDLRMTYDRRVRVRWDMPSLDVTNGTEQLLEDGLSVLEIKTSRALPGWLVYAISSLGLRQQRWSKYGTACRVRGFDTPVYGTAPLAAPSGTQVERTLRPAIALANVRS